jgi:Fe-S-cluster containining protein
MMKTGSTEKITADTCRSCGICCVSLTGSEVYCDVTVEDMKRLSKGFVRKNVVRSSLFDRLAHALDGNRIPDGAVKTVWKSQKAGPLKGVEVCACAALRGSVMNSVSCSVYEHRPRVCQTAVVPGDKTCRQARGMFQRFLDESVQEKDEP